MACTVKGVEELVAQFQDSSYAAGFLSVVVALCYWATVYALELLPNTILFTPTVRKLLADYAYPVSSGFLLRQENISDLHTFRFVRSFGPDLFTSLGLSRRLMSSDFLLRNLSIPLSTGAGSCSSIIYRSNGFSWPCL